MTGGAAIGSGPYRAMPRPVLSHGDLAARALEPEQVEPVRQWRNASMDVLRQSRDITAEEQQRYFETQVWPGKAATEPRQILLSLERGGRLIGYAGLVHINWDYRRAEVSFLLDPAVARTDAEAAPVFADYLHIAETLAFQDLGLHRLVAETYATRQPFIAAFEAHGFTREGRLREHVRVQGRATDAFLHGLLATDRVAAG
ncbi:GNAT family N-acetyltransferase [Rhodobacterales bacterium HKCCE2091]|nr:GNAT family N-acetyltransferase [Rhodobacterales bacterium HKCCE2091]